MITHATSIQIPWHIARATRLAMMPTIITLQTVGWFWSAWSEVYRGGKTCRP